MEQIVNFNNKIVILGLGTTSRCLVDVIDRHIKCPLENITILEPGEASDKDFELIQKKGFHCCLVCR